MDVKLFASNDSAEWNNAIANLTCGHVLQSYEWGEFKARWGWQPVRLLFEDNGQIKAAASILKRSLPFPGLNIMYVPKGPCFDMSDKSLFPIVLQKLISLARRHRAVFIKIDPDIPQDDTTSIEILRSLGFRPSEEQVQFRNTAIIDLSLPEEELRRRLRREARYYLNVARKGGVGVTEGKEDDLPLFYDIYLETSQRNRFPIRPYSYYEEAWKDFLGRGLAKFLLARHQGDVLAGIIIFYIGNRAWYIYGASRSMRRELRPNHLLQWEAMLALKREGISYYDLWGLPNVLEPGQPMWGVVQFKKSLGGEIREWIGAYDYVVHPLWNRLYSQVIPKYVGFLRRLNELKTLSD